MMTDKVAEISLNELYRKRDIMSHEIGRLLEDYSILHDIGFMDYESYIRHCYERWPDAYGREITKIKGHKLSIIRYYCDTL